jgi:hypothetical protein
MLLGFKYLDSMNQETNKNKIEIKLFDFDALLHISLAE